MKKFIATVTLTVLFVLCAASALAASVGMVLTVQAGAWLERDGQKSALQVKSEVLPGDVLVTDASGRVQVIFSDDTTISLGADTRVAVADFLFDVPGKQPSFSANMAQGAARFVTGKVVEQNRAGFSVTTPQATVGIRGTTFAVSVTPKGVTSVIGLKVDGAFPIAVTNLKTGTVSTISASGMAVDAAPSGNTSYQAPPGQFSQTGSAVSGQPKVAAASAGQTSGTGDAGALTAAAPSGALSTAGAAVTSAGSASLPVAGSLYNSETGASKILAESSGKSPGDILGALGTPGTPGTGPGPTLTATYAGNINMVGASYAVGDFSFDAALSAGSGSISNARFGITGSTYGQGLVARQGASSASVTGGHFNVPMKVSVPAGDTSIGNAASLKGHFSPDYNSVSGKWDVKPNNTTQNHFYSGGPGDFVGNRQ